MQFVVLALEESRTENARSTLATLGPMKQPETHGAPGLGPRIGTKVPM